MIHRAEVLYLDSDEVEVNLGEFESANEARIACARHEGEGIPLQFVQVWEGQWEAQGEERWYRVTSSQ